MDDAAFLTLGVNVFAVAISNEVFFFFLDVFSSSQTNKGGVGEEAGEEEREEAKNEELIPKGWTKNQSLGWEGLFYRKQEGIYTPQGEGKGR